MFDYYSQGAQHARHVAWSHAQTRTTWPEVARQDRAAQVRTNPARVLSRSRLHLAIMSWLAHLGYWLMSLLRQAARSRQVSRRYPPIQYRVRAGR